MTRPLRIQVLRQNEWRRKVLAERADEGRKRAYSTCGRTYNYQIVAIGLVRFGHHLDCKPMNWKRTPTCFMSILVAVLLLYHLFHHAATVVESPNYDLQLRAYAFQTVALRAGSWPCVRVQ